MDDQLLIAIRDELQKQTQLLQLIVDALVKKSSNVNLDQPIGIFNNWSVRARKYFHRLNLRTIGDLVHHDWVDMKNFGQTSMVDVVGNLASLGLTLDPKPKAKQ